MQADIDRILIPRERIAARTRELADEIGRLYANAEHDLVMVAILSGAIIFVADLIRHLPIKLKMGLVTVSSYPGRTTESLGPSLLSPLQVNVAGRDVLIVDDILDTGRTLGLVQAEIAAMRPSTLRTCVLLRKPSRDEGRAKADLVGFDIENVFVIGYGLDYNGHYRNFPDIAVLKSHLYE